MAAEIGEATREDFDAVLAAMDSARGADGEVDEVTVALLVAAKNDVLLYDISKWGEDVGSPRRRRSPARRPASKTRDHRHGEGPDRVGRARLRLKLGDERLNGLDAAELAAEVAEMMA